eukprot:365377-Chlamydomonas_euryale.AAC.14
MTSEKLACPHLVHSPAAHVAYSSPPFASLCNVSIVAVCAYLIRLRGFDCYSRTTRTAGITSACPPPGETSRGPRGRTKEWLTAGPDGSSCPPVMQQLAPRRGAPSASQAPRSTVQFCMPRIGGGGAAASAAQSRGAASQRGPGATPAYWLAPTSTSRALLVDRLGSPGSAPPAVAKSRAVVASAAASGVQLPAQMPDGWPMGGGAGGVGAGERGEGQPAGAGLAPAVRTCVAAFGAMACAALWWSATTAGAGSPLASMSMAMPAGAGATAAESDSPERMGGREEGGVLVAGHGLGANWTRQVTSGSRG